MLVNNYSSGNPLVRLLKLLNLSINFQKNGKHAYPAPKNLQVKRNCSWRRHRRIGCWELKKQSLFRREWHLTFFSALQVWRWSGRVKNYRRFCESKRWASLPFKRIHKGPVRNSFTTKLKNPCEHDRPLYGQVLLYIWGAAFLIAMLQQPCESREPTQTEDTATREMRY